MAIHESTTISGQVRTGRYVIVQINNGGDYLNLKEVKAFGEVQINASFHSHPYLLMMQWCGHHRTFVGAELLQPFSAALSSEYLGFPATKCIDGDTEGPAKEGNMCHSKEPGEPSPWLAIDYGVSVTVERVEIFTREDCCGNRIRNVHVRVSNELPSSGSQMFSGDSLLGFFAGGAADGQHIIVSGKNEHLFYW